MWAGMPITAFSSKFLDGIYDSPPNVHAFVL
jgi:hypothetical protein